MRAAREGDAKEPREITSGRDSGRRRPKGYCEWRPYAKWVAIVGQVDEILAEYEEQLPLTVRQIFYRLVAAYGYPKTEQAYNALADKLVLARRSRRIPFQAIRDDGVTSCQFVWHTSIQDFWNDTARKIRAYRRDRQAGQDYRVELWCEAAGMAPQLATVADEFSVPVYSCGGFASLSAVRMLVNRAARRDTPTVLLHVGDYDPSGESIFEALTADAQTFLAEDRLLALQEIIPVRGALTAEQVAEYNLPTAPPKPSDSRSRSWQGEPANSRRLRPISSQRSSKLTCAPSSARTSSSARSSRSDSIGSSSSWACRADRRHEPCRPAVRSVRWRRLGSGTRPAPASGEVLRPRSLRWPPGRARQRPRRPPLDVALAPAAHATDRRGRLREGEPPVSCPPLDGPPRDVESLRNLVDAHELGRHDAEPSRRLGYRRCHKVRHGVSLASRPAGAYNTTRYLTGRRGKMPTTPIEDVLRQAEAERDERIARAVGLGGLPSEDEQQAVWAELSRVGSMLEELLSWRVEPITESFDGSELPAPVTMQDIGVVAAIGNDLEQFVHDVNRLLEPVPKFIAALSGIRAEQRTQLWRERQERGEEQS